MVVKKFHFPSKKQIIFESVYMMIMTKLSPLTFNHEVIVNLIEQLSIYGTSIEKLRGILKLIIIDFVCQSNHLNVHVALKKKYRKLMQDDA